ncbi:MAG: hypothetical protein LBG17_03260 [Bacteroidales bacterium]|jgi:hypothetical protein|nr:hypothetical protein [Bacteroidales bacterium]
MKTAVKTKTAKKTLRIKAEKEAKTVRVVRITDDCRENIKDFLVTDFSRFIGEMRTINGISYVRAYIDLIKYIVPPAQGAQIDNGEKDEEFANMLGGLTKDK